MGRGKAFHKHDCVSAWMGVAVLAAPGCHWGDVLSGWVLFFHPFWWSQHRSCVLTVALTVRLDKRECFLDYKIRPVSLYCKRTLGFLYLCVEKGFRVATTTSHVSVRNYIAFML